MISETESIYMLKVKSKNHSLDTNRHYSAREVYLYGFIPRKPVYKTILKYISETYTDIFLPIKKGGRSGTRYYVQGKNIERFVDDFNNSRLYSKHKKIDSLLNNEEWLSVRSVCDRKLIPYVSTYKTFKRKLRDKDFSSILKIRVFKNGGAKRIYINIDSIKELLKKYPNGKKGKVL